ncbi:MAG: triphosphoribosyl-dephospho-CoA synthase CitG [Clostridia bacterium]|nr:triphosphoribosyl-dephospho-CoA synthase CitG [Clostridia bacterium]
MNINETYGKELPLWQLLSCREERVSKQQMLFDEFHLPLICFTLNIAGPVKRFALADEAFFYGYNSISDQLLNGGFAVKYAEYIERDSGFEGYFVIAGDALEIKKMAVSIEESCPAHRLFDIDVIRPDGTKVSRSELEMAERKCLVCDNPAAVCGRSRAHGLNTIIERTHFMLRELVYSRKAEDIAKKAVKALLDEVYTTPKPGLVDRNNSGAHTDMDIALFEKSAHALSRYFHDISLMGMTAENCRGALSSLREIGKNAESTMLEATNGVNTHKGAIFSMGIMCYAVGFLMGQSEKITAEKLRKSCKEVCCDVMADFDGIADKSKRTAGEEFYLNHHIAGIRGEAYYGFPAVFDLALPFFEDIKRNGFSENEAGCIILLQLMAQIEDTNVLKRGGTDGLMRCMTKAKHLLSVRLPLTELMDELKRFDEEMIRMNLSPGGCADLLALTYFADSII